MIFPEITKTEELVENKKMYQQLEGPKNPKARFSDE